MQRSLPVPTQKIHSLKETSEKLRYAIVLQVLTALVFRTDEFLQHVAIIRSHSVVNWCVVVIIIQLLDDAFLISPILYAFQALFNPFPPELGVLLISTTRRLMRPSAFTFDVPTWTAEISPVSTERRSFEQLSSPFALQSLQSGEHMQHVRRGTHQAWFSMPCRWFERD